MADAFLSSITKDLDIMQAMLGEMAGYLKRDAVYGPMPSSMPKLTIGAYLMRQHRLRALAANLDQPDYERLHQLTTQFEQLLAENVVSSEAKMYQELAARLTQWSTYLAEVERNVEAYAFEYPTAVQNRVILSELLKFLTLPPYQFNEDWQTQVHKQDQLLKSIWEDGGFIWPDVWQAAYPKTIYWWLYGQPTKQSENQSEYVQTVA